MKKKQRTKRINAPKSAVKDLSPRNSAQVKAGRLNAGGVNPIVISRDRSLSGS